MRADDPEVWCGPGDLHVAETARLLVVTSRANDYSRWWRQSAEDPDVSRDMPEKSVREARRITLGRFTDPLDEPQRMIPVDPDSLFFAGIDSATRLLVGGVTITSTARGSEIGGSLGGSYRGQGYGRELLGMVCALAHRHFGFARLAAGSEVTNVASQRWLAGCGFVQVAGPPTHTLPNGRVAEALWWERSDPAAEQHCPRPLPRPGRSWRLFGRRWTA